jgi:LEA14-like dessication related protein
MTIRFVIPILGLVSLLVAGCGSVQQPTARFRSADVGAASADGFRINFGVDVGNPNGFELPISGAKYKLALGGVPVIDDTANPSGSVPAKGSLPVTIPVALSFEKLLSAEKSLVASGGNVPYEFDGELDFSAGMLKSLGQSVKVPLKFSGTLPFRDAIKDPMAFVNTPAGRRVVELLIGKSKLGELLDLIPKK